MSKCVDPYFSTLDNNTIGNIGSYLNKNDSIIFGGLSKRLYNLSHDKSYLLQKTNDYLRIGQDQLESLLLPQSNPFCHNYPKRLCLNDTNIDTSHVKGWFKQSHKMLVKSYKDDIFLSYILPSLIDVLCMNNYNKNKKNAISIMHNDANINLVIGILKRILINNNDAKYWKQIVKVIKDRFSQAIMSMEPTVALLQSNTKLNICDTLITILEMCWKSHSCEVVDVFTITYHLMRFRFVSSIQTVEKVMRLILIIIKDENFSVGSVWLCFTCIFLLMPTFGHSPFSIDDKMCVQGFFVRFF